MLWESDNTMLFHYALDLLDGDLIETLLLTIQIEHIIGFLHVEVRPLSQLFLHVLYMSLYFYIGSE